MLPPVIPSRPDSQAIEQLQFPSAGQRSFARQGELTRSRRLLWPVYLSSIEMAPTMTIWPARRITPTSLSQPQPVIGAVSALRENSHRAGSSSPVNSMFFVKVASSMPKAPNKQRLLNSSIMSRTYLSSFRPPFPPSPLRDQDPYRPNTRRPQAATAVTAAIQLVTAGMTYGFKAMGFLHIL